MRITKGRLAIVAVAVAALGLGATGAANAQSPIEPRAAKAAVAISYPLAYNSVSTNQIVNRSITSSDINAALVTALVAVPANGVDTSAKLKDGVVAEQDLEAGVKAKLNDTKGQVTGVEADGPYPGATDLGSLPGQGDNSDETVPADSKSHAVWVQCAEGKTALGGGFRLGADQGDAVTATIQVTASEPTQIKAGKVVVVPIEGDAAQSIEPNGWLVEVINSGTAAATVRPWVTCAKIAK